MGLEYKMRMQTVPVTKTFQELSLLLPLATSTLTGVEMLMLERFPQQNAVAFIFLVWCIGGNGLYVFEQV